MTNTRSVKSRLQGIMFKLPFMITCREFEDFIHDYLEGELAPRQKSIFEMHMALCAECREYLRKYKESQALTKRTLEQAVTADVPDDLIRAILAAKAEDAEGQS